MDKAEIKRLDDDALISRFEELTIESAVENAFTFPKERDLLRQEILDRMKK